MSAHPTAAALVDEQIRVAEAMLAGLDAEHRALEAGDTDGLHDAGAAKAQLVVELEGLEGQRVQRVASGDVVPESAWSRLQSLLLDCQARNQKNGELVRWRQAHVSRALSVLRGDELELYDAGGLAAPAGRGQSLGEV